MVILAERHINNCKVTAVCQLIFAQFETSELCCSYDHMIILFLFINNNYLFLFCSCSCDVSQYWSVDYINANSTIITSSVLSMNDRVLWIGTEEGLFMLNTRSTYLSEDNETAVAPALDIDEPVISLSWRAGIGEDCEYLGFRSHTFLLNNLITSCLDISYNGGGVVYTGSGDGCGFGLLVIGTRERLYFYDGRRVWYEWVSQWEEGLGGVIDGPPTSLTFVPSGDLFIGNNVSLSRLFVNYTFQRLGPREGLPYGDILSLHFTSFTVSPPPLLRPLFFSSVKSCGGTLLVGMGKGYALFDVRSSSFISYHYGPRWLPGESIRTASSVAMGVFVLVSDNGVVVLSGEEWTLERKATHYQEMLSRHTREPGKLYM